MQAYFDDYAGGSIVGVSTGLSGAYTPGDATFNQLASALDSLPIGSGQWSNTVQTTDVCYIVDEKGDVLGQLTTSDFIGSNTYGDASMSGIAGMTYLGNPWENGSYNEIWEGSASSLLTYGGQTFQVEGFVSVSPIIIDLYGDGKPDVDRGDWKPHAKRFNIRKARMFDIDGCGEPELTEWLGPRSGLLVAPKEEVSKVGGNELFGTAVGYVDGYQKLAELRDANHDGVISGKELKGLMVWINKANDGICKPSELFSVAELGITSIDCRHKGFKSTCVIKGKVCTTWDWWPTCMKVRKVASR